MKFSFVVTTYNIDKYIRECLQSVLSCAQPGDEVIIVDDGSTDRTIDEVKNFICDSQTPGVDIRTAFLGVNTFGGVGIGANIGVEMAKRDAVFFVDGDDYLDKEGFNKARKKFTSLDVDLMVCNYLEWDEKNNQSKFPADQHRWDNLKCVSDSEDALHKALSLIAVPWRKFYKRNLLSENNIRFPEGDFFFEDNPYHWTVCRFAQRIEFFNTIVCHHRINRPGQTMESKGHELKAFFTHFFTISETIDSGSEYLFELACKWLINNMTWHIARIHTEAAWSYFESAKEALMSIPRDTWEGPLKEAFCTKSIWPLCQSLRTNSINDVMREFINRRELDKLHASYAKLSREISKIDRDIKALATSTKIIKEISEGQRLIEEFRIMSSSMRGA